MIYVSVPIRVAISREWAFMKLSYLIGTEGEQEVCEYARNFLNMGKESNFSLRMRSAFHVLPVTEASKPKNPSAQVLLYTPPELPFILGFIRLTDWRYNSLRNLGARVVTPDGLALIRQQPGSHEDLYNEHMAGIRRYHPSHARNVAKADRHRQGRSPFDT